MARQDYDHAQQADEFHRATEQAANKFFRPVYNTPTTEELKKALDNLKTTLVFNIPIEPPEGAAKCGQTVESKVAHGSGATSSHYSPFNFLNPFEGSQLTCQRFKEGNRKHEDNNPVYSEANWLKAFYARDVAFFRDRAGHALEHLIAEMRGDDDDAPGGNLGAVGWWQEVMAFVKKHDPYLYAAIQGKYAIRAIGQQECGGLR